MGKTKRVPFLIENHEKDLESIKRYGKFKVMFYRTNLLIHTKRIRAIIESLLPFLLEIYPDLDVELMFLFVDHHDDPEIITGDYPLQLKLLMNEEEQERLKKEEVDAVNVLAKDYPKKIKGYNYKEFMMRVMQKNCVESQIVSFVDKVDGYCEALHELLAGNNVFLEPIWNYPHETFNKHALVQKYPLLEKILNSNNYFFKTKMVFDIKDFYKSGTIGAIPHNEETINRFVGFGHYQTWRDISIDTFGKSVLIEQKEFFKV